MFVSLIVLQVFLGEGMPLKDRDNWWMTEKWGGTCSKESGIKPGLQH